MALPAQNYMSNNSRTEGEMKVALEDQRDAIASTPGGAPSVELTIAAGVVTPTATAGDFRVDTEADAAADDLTNILQTNSWETRRIRLRCENAARVTTLKHGAGGGGQILTVDGADFALNDTGRWIDLEDVGNDWVERARGYDDNWPALHDFLRIAAVPAHNTLCPHARLRLDYATASTITIAADAVVLSDSGARLKRFPSLSETLNIANTGANGRDVIDAGGAEQSSVWYHIWAIGKNDGTLDTFASATCYPGSVNSIYAILPSGYTWAGYLGAAYNDGFGNLIPFKQRGPRVLRASGVAVSGGNSTSYVSVGLSAQIPQTASVVLFRTDVNPSGSGNGNGYLYGYFAPTVADTYAAIASHSDFDGQYGASQESDIILDTPQQAYYRVSVSTCQFSVHIRGWEF